ncbi:hypothetical protein [Microbacterium arborescens]|uniref:hypothetical protein n=1 Tax=Microbacterium arborescens TaxID=33883 RepID=UPI002786EE3C|nr:hypothetical protein [Microbacterium arborescens]MDQ1217989.1 hypothetical protein [Microbacterium arborescens]
MNEQPMPAVPEDLFVIDEAVAEQEAIALASAVVAGDDAKGKLQRTLDTTGSPTYTKYLADRATDLVMRIVNDPPPPLIGSRFRRHLDAFTRDALSILVDATRADRPNTSDPT